jgi:hypothetical protein
LRHARGRRTIARQRDQLVAILFAEKTAPNHAPSESTKLRNASNFSRFFNESGYIGFFPNFVDKVSAVLAAALGAAAGSISEDRG